MWDQIKCPICGKEFVPASEHALTDGHGNFVCSCRCSSIAYDRQEKKTLLGDKVVEDENRRSRERYHRKKKEASGEKAEKKPRFMKPVLVIRKSDGAIMGRHPSVRAAAEATGVAATTISEICRGNEQVTRKYTFMFEKEEHRPKNGKAEYSRTPTTKAVLQFSQRGEFIARYDSQREASAATGVSHSNISQCCCHRQYQSGGFVFMLESEFKNFEQSVKPLITFDGTTTPKIKINS